MNIKEFQFITDVENRNTIAIDFDGVIHNWDKGWHDGTCYGEPIEGAIDSIKELSKDYNIIIFTAKCKPDRPMVNGKSGYQLVLEWLIKYGLDDYVNEITCEKPRAQIYIDDKGYYFQSWKKTLKDVNERL